MDNVILDTNKSDQYVWIYHSSRSFFVKSFSNMVARLLSNQSEAYSFSKQVWHGVPLQRLNCLFGLWSLVDLRLRIDLRKWTFCNRISSGVCSTIIDWKVFNTCFLNAILLSKYGAQFLNGRAYLRLWQKIQEWLLNLGNWIISGGWTSNCGIYISSH